MEPLNDLKVRLQWETLPEPLLGDFESAVGAPCAAVDRTVSRPGMPHPHRLSTADAQKAMIPGTARLGRRPWRAPFTLGQ